jgi:putative membrane protein
VSFALAANGYGKNPVKVRQNFITVSLFITHNFETISINLIRSVMKKIKLFMKLFFATAALSLFLGVTSCKNEAKETDTKEAAEDANDAAFEQNDAREDDSEFLVAAAETDLMEIEIGKLAQSKGTDQGVKDFGKMLVADHTKSANDTKPFAERLNVTLPTAITEKGKEHYNELNEQKTGMDFDMKFADMMVKGHEEAVGKMEKASTDANDAEVRAWAAGMVPTLKMHLEHAKTLQEQLKNKK